MFNSNYFKALFFIFLLVSSSIFVIFLKNHNKWKEYYSRSQALPPNKLLVDHLYLLNKTTNKYALDLGAGVGNETVFLMKNGWHVLAVDSEPLAIQAITKRTDVKNYTSYLKTHVMSFETLDWGNISKVDLVLACYSLPFCNPKNFSHVWQQLVIKINKNGFFIGEFFGPNYQGFSSKEATRMTFLNKQQVLDLFKSFRIISFKEINEKSKTRLGKEINAHIFEIVAQKVNE